MPYRSVSVNTLEATISETAVLDTRTAFLRTAKRLFAERGFHGVSLAQVAAEHGLTKQALIHHFGTKEKLYGEVLEQMARGLGGLVESARSVSDDAGAQLETLFVRLQANTLDYPEDTQLMLRELLDNRDRARGAHHWPMKRFLDQVSALLRRAAPQLSDTDALAHTYAMLGAINFFAASQPTLREMYGEAVLAALRARFPAEIRRLTQGR